MESDDPGVMMPELGRVKPGYLADLVIVQGHPEEKIEALRNVLLVTKSGALYPAPAGKF